MENLSLVPNWTQRTIIWKKSLKSQVDTTTQSFCPRSPEDVLIFGNLFLGILPHDQLNLPIVVDIRHIHWPEKKWRKKCANFHILAPDFTICPLVINICHVYLPMWSTKKNLQLFRHLGVRKTAHLYTWVRYLFICVRHRYFWVIFFKHGFFTFWHQILRFVGTGTVNSCSVVEPEPVGARTLWPSRIRNNWT